MTHAAVIAGSTRNPCPYTGHTNGNVMIPFT